MLCARPLLLLLLLLLLATAAAQQHSSLHQIHAAARQAVRRRFDHVTTAQAVVAAFRQGRQDYEQLELEQAGGGGYELYAESVALCEVGCATLAEIVAEPEARKERAAARDAGAIKHMIKTCIADESLHEGVCEECVAALHAMAVRPQLGSGHALTESEDKESLEQIFQLQLVRNLVLVLVSHSLSRSVAAHGVHLLAALTVYEHWICSERIHRCLSKQAVVDAGAIPAITYALQQFPGESQVQQWGVMALRALGDADSIIAGDLGLNPYDVVVARPPAGNMDWIIATRETLAAHGTVGLVVVAMELHPGIARLQEEGCWLLSMLTTHTLEQKEAARTAGGIGVALAAMRAHLDTSSIQSACLSPLVAMLGPSGWSPDGWDATGSPISDSGSLDGFTKRNELYSLVQGRLGSPDDIAWREMSCDPDYMSPGIVETIGQAMRAHPTDSILQHAGCVAVGTLVSLPQEEGEQVCMREARAAGIPKLIVDALNANRGVKHIAVECTKAVAELTADRLLARDLLRVGALREMVEVMSTKSDGRDHLQSGPLDSSIDTLNHYISLRRMNCCKSLRNLWAGGDDLHKLLVEREEWWVWCENHAKLGDDMSRIGFAFGQMLGYCGMALTVYLPWRAWRGGTTRDSGGPCSKLCPRCFKTQGTGDPHRAKLDKRRRKLKKHARE